MKRNLSIIMIILSNWMNSQIIAIPDANFKFILTHSTYFPYSGYDTNGDGEIEQSEANNINDLQLINKEIHDLTGIEHFTNLISLTCYYNYVQTLEIPNLTNLHQLTIVGNHNNLTSINVSGCSNLEYISCGSDPIANINLSGCVSLTEFKCIYNSLTTIDFTGLVNLKKIEVSYGGLTNVIFNNNINLKEIDINNNLTLQTLDVTSLSNLTTLKCENNALIDLKVSNLNELWYIGCEGNNLKTLNLENLTNLNELDCDNNELETININTFQNLTSISCDNNQLSKIVFNNAQPGLPFRLNCRYNKLQSLEVDRIDVLECDDNYLTSLNLRGNPIAYLSCRDNCLRYINLTSTASLPYYENIYIDLTNNPDLKFICADDFQVDNINAYLYSIQRNDISVDSDCDFKPVIFPNPTSSNILINSPINIKTIYIYNSIGQLVKKIDEVNDSYKDINISDLLTGTYYVTISGQYNEKIMSKIIKL